MTNLTITPSVSDSSRIIDLLAGLTRRIEATGPGVCSLAIQLAALEVAAAQTCGKCVPCRDGLPQMTAVMRRVVSCEANEAELTSMKVLAEMIRDTSDCAIGYEAARSFLESLEIFQDEYRSHLVEHICGMDIAQTVPCETMCPAHVDVPAYIALAGAGDFEAAIDVIRADNPFPTACALVCEHPCETRCRRALIDAPINIRGIKKYIVDQLAADKVCVPTPGPATGKSIAIIGGGPSGLTCAYYLALMGHHVVIYEARKQVGGMLRYGIPAYRLPRERLNEDIRAILSLDSIEVKRETPVGLDMMREISKAYDAVYVAVGAQAGKMLQIEGADSAGVMSAVELLGACGQGETPDFSGRKVAVVGGGNVAMDCARTAVRAGADEVSVVYRRRKEDMTALDREVEAAVAEGIELAMLESPVSVEADAAGTCTALITQPQVVGEIVGGKPSVTAADKSSGKVDADVVLVAVGQAVASDELKRFGMKVTRGCFDVDERLQVEALPNVFAGGDCTTGPATAIRAIGAGKVAARNIDEFLGYHHTLPRSAKAPEVKSNDRTPKGRVEITERPARERKRDFDYVENPMSPEEAVQECGRCLRCDHFGSGALEEGRTRYV